LLVGLTHLWFWKAFSIFYWKPLCYLLQNKTGFRVESNQILYLKTIHQQRSYSCETWLAQERCIIWCLQLFTLWFFECSIQNQPVLWEAEVFLWRISILVKYFLVLSLYVWFCDYGVLVLLCWPVKCIKELIFLPFCYLYTYLMHPLLIKTIP